MSSKLSAIKLKLLPRYSFQRMYEILKMVFVKLI